MRFCGRADRRFEAVQWEREVVSLPLEFDGIHGS